MWKEISFWLAVLAIIAFAVGTLPTIHGLLCWFVGVLFVIALRYMARWEGHQKGEVAVLK